MSRLARRDVTEILQYTEESWGRHQRNVYLRDLVRAGRQLATFPEMGRDADNGIRELVLRHHVVLYQYDDESVTILRVLNPRQLRR
jgi:toxin ParE1/3/4